jgi:ubiquitin conjugation factor E4 B
VAIREQELGQGGAVDSGSEAPNVDMMRTVLNLGNSTVHLLWLMTKCAPDAFTHADHVQRVAQTVAFYLSKLVGKTVQSLNVSNKEELQFRPRILLREIVGMLLNLAFSDEFVSEVARDQRSYTPEVFAAILRVCDKRQIITPGEITRLRVLLPRLEGIRKEQESEDEEMGEEVPEEFLDPLMSTLMRDPVMLPRGTVMDRTTLTRHLQTSATDPFTRAPLTIEEVVPAVEIKARIEAYLLHCKREKATSTTT